MKPKKMLNEGIVVPKALYEAEMWGLTEAERYLGIICGLTY